MGSVVGSVRSECVEAPGVKNVADLTRRWRKGVAREFGATGVWIHDLAQGIDTHRVTLPREEKSRGMEHTFPEDVGDREELRILLFVARPQASCSKRGLCAP